MSSWCSRSGRPGLDYLPKSAYTHLQPYAHLRESAVTSLGIGRRFDVVTHKHVDGATELHLLGPASAVLKTVATWHLREA